MELRNYMEDIVLQHLDMVLDRYPTCCRCDQCRQDIAMIALNNLKPHYISTEKGELFTRINSLAAQYQVEVIGAIAKAIEIVSENPRHEKKA